MIIQQKMWFCGYTWGYGWQKCHYKK